MRWIWALWSVLMLLLPIQRMAAQSALRMQNYSHELSEHMVTDIRQDERGFLWFSTWNGLHRFDGYTFKNYKTYPGEECVMESNRILEIVIGKSGMIYCRDHERNLYLFDPIRERFYYLPLEQINNTTSKPSFRLLKTFENGQTILVSNDRVVQINEAQLDIEQGRGMRTRWFKQGENPLGISKIVDVLLSEEEEICLVGDRKLFIGEREVAMPEGVQILSATRYTNRICLLTDHHQLLFISTKSGSMERISLPKQVDTPDFVMALDEERIAVATHHGAWLYTPWNRRFMHIDLARCGTPDTHVSNFFVDSRKQLWMHTYGDGVVRYDLEQGDLQYLQSPKEDIPYASAESIPFCFEDANGTFWVLPRGGTLGYFDYEEQCLKTYYADPALPETRFTPTMLFHFLDRQGNLWYTGTSGLYRITLRPDDIRYRTLDTGYDTRALMTDRHNRLWVATKGGYVRIFNADLTLEGYLGGDGAIYKTPTRFVGNVYKILETKEGDLWMGTRLRGLCHLQPVGENRYRITHYRHDPNDPFSISGDSIFDLFIDSRNRLWVGTYDGGINLVQQDAGKVRFLHAENYFSQYPIELGANIRAIEEKDDALMLGTISGLITFPLDFTEGKQVPFYINRMRPEDSYSLPANDIHSIFTDSRGDCYAMSFTGGISRALSPSLLTDTIRFHTFNNKDGLQSELTHTMREDRNGMLWVISENSITRFNPKTESFESYGERQRIYTETQPTFLGNDLVVGTNGGIALIRTDAPQKSSYVPPIAFSSLKISRTGEERMVDHLNQIELNPEERDIQIQFAALDYANPTTIEYHYRMQGLETEWNRVVGHHTASYTDLRPGKYRFEVYSTNSDGVKVYNLRSLEVVVTPRFRETPWAMLLIALAVMALILTALSVYLHIYRLRSRIGVEQHLTDIKLRFFTDVSHELRTPLTLIASPVDEVLEHEALSDKARNHLGIVQQNTQRMLRLINQILDFRKIENGKMKLLVEQVELLPLLQRIAENFHLMAERNRNEYTIQLPERGLLGWMDRDKVEKICVNLLSNAFKYTPEGRGIHFSVSANTQQLTIIVSDEGIGMDQKAKERLFRRFENILGTTNFPSSGIGLSLIKELIDLMEGTIEVESTPGVGSCFTVQLPICRDHYARLAHAELVISEPTAGSATEADTLPIPPDDNEKMTLLVVEDNQELRTVLNDILSSEYRVVTAANGAEGLELARTESPDLILTDVMMPVMDGLEMVSRIKSDQALCHLPIVILSAKSSLDDRISGLEQGIDDYITKPFVGSYLKARIRNLLNHYRTMRERFLSQLTAPNSRLEEISPIQPHLLSQDEEFMKHLMAVIEKHMDNTEITIEEFARELNMAHSTFYNKIKALLGITPVEFIREMRLKRAHQLLASGAYDVSSVSYMVGFSDPRYFSKCFKKRFGISPSRVKE